MMMRRIAEFSLKASRTVVAIFIAIAIFGVIQLQDAKTEILPEFDPPTVRVQTDALGLSAEEVEQLVTVPIEQDLLDGVPWLHSIHSRSVPGLSYIEMVFDKGTPIYRARQVVQERISQAAGLPNVSRPPQMLQPQSSASRTAMVALSSKSLSPIQIGVLARFTIRPRLLAVAGVSNVAVWGQRERQLQVLVDPAKLRSQNVSIEQVVSSTGNALWVSPLTFLEASTPGTGGFIDTANQRLGIQHNLPLIEPKDLAKIAIDDTAGVSLTLGDVATVVEDHQPLIGDAVVAGDGNFLIVVEKLPGANTAAVARGVEDALAKLRPGLAGLEMDTTVFQPMAYLEKTVSNVRRSVVVGTGLLLFGLALFLLQWKRVLIALASILVSYTISATVLKLFGVTFNSFVLVGLAATLGALIDGSISTFQGATRSAVASTDGAPDSLTTKTSVLSFSTLRAGKTAVWSTVIFVVALLPIFFMNGASGDSFFPPVAVAGCTSLITGLIVSFTLTPALRTLLDEASSPSVETSASRTTTRAYEKSLTVFAKSAVPAVAVAAVLALGAGLAIPSFDKALLPKFKDTNLLVRWQAPYGTSLPEMTRIMSLASAELRTVPGVLRVGSQIGQAVGGDRPVGSDSAEMFISLKPSANYTRAVKAVSSVVEGYPGMSHRVTTYAGERLRKTLGRTSNEVSVRVFGQDLGLLRKKAEEVKRTIGNVNGISQAHVTTLAAEPTIQVEVDLAKAQALAIKPGDVRRASETLLSGLRVGNLFQDQKIFDVTVWGRPEIRTSVSSVRDLLIDTPAGRVIRLGDVADVSVRATQPVIEHEDISRYLDVTANVTNRDVGAVTSDVRNALKKISMPQEFHTSILSEYSNQQSAQRRVFAFSIAALVGVFLLFQAAFSSWRLATLALPAVLLGVTGGIFAAWMYGDTMSLATVTGLIAVFAFGTRCTYALIQRFVDHRVAGIPVDSSLMQWGANERFVPLVTGSVVTALVFVPVLVFGNIAGQELLYPMTAVIIGGLITTLLVNLYVLPSLYLRFAPKTSAVAMNVDLLVSASEY
jgi:Cu/Ag efflux pump CusA